MVARKHEISAAIASAFLGWLLCVLLVPQGWLYFWLAQLVVIALVCVFMPRPTFGAGVALALALYLAGFVIWVRTLTHPDSLIGLFFLFTMPGGLLGPFAMSLWLLRRPTPGPLRAGLLGLMSALVGIALNIAVFALR